MIRSYGWLGRQGSNLRMTASKAVALPLGDAPLVSCVAQNIRPIVRRRKALLGLFSIALKVLSWATDIALQRTRPNPPLRMLLRQIKCSCLCLARISK